MRVKIEGRYVRDSYRVKLIRTAKTSVSWKRYPY